MLIALIKFFHVLVAMSILCFTGFCIFQVNRNTHLNTKLSSLNKLLLLLSLLSLFTGTLLVRPEHFNFHTHWILAAYYLLVIFILCIVLILQLRKKYLLSNQAMNAKQRYVWRTLYLLLFIILLLITHDAINQATFLF